MQKQTNKKMTAQQKQLNHEEDEARKANKVTME